MNYIALDPGNSTGWVVYNDVKRHYISGGTIGESLFGILDLLEYYKPEVVIYERFALYPKLAKSMAWNTFYPCEVIGVIKLWCQMHEITPVSQGADIKKYNGGEFDEYAAMKLVSPIGCTEHTKDAYMHMQYYLRNRKYT